MFPYNATKHRISFTPLYLLYGRETKMPLERTFPFNPDESMRCIILKFEVRKGIFCSCNTCHSQKRIYKERSFILKRYSECLRQFEVGDKQKF